MADPSYAFCTSTDNSTIGNGITPVSIGDWKAQLIGGSSIAMTSNGPVLQPGTYLVRYNATLRGRGRDTVAMGLVLSGTPVPGSVQAGYPSSTFDSEQLAGSALVLVTNPGSLLSLAIWTSGCKIALNNSDTVSAQMTVYPLN